MANKVLRILLLLNAFLSLSGCSVQEGFNKLGWFVFVVMIFLVIYLVIERNKDKEESLED